MNRIARFFAWLRRVNPINERTDCPKCGRRGTGELIGEWGVEMRKCEGCGHYWEVPYAQA